MVDSKPNEPKIKNTALKSVLAGIFYVKKADWPED